MIMKKTGLVIAAAAAAIVLSACTTGARNVPENSPICEAPPCAAPCAAPCNTCKCVSSCKTVCCPPRHHHRRHHRHHRRCRAENAQTQMDA